MGYLLKCLISWLKVCVFSALSALIPMDTSLPFPSLLYPVGLKFSLAVASVPEASGLPPGTIFRTGSSDSSLGVDVRRVSL